jgi:hypothetical protein
MRTLHVDDTPRGGEYGLDGLAPQRLGLALPAMRVDDYEEAAPGGNIWQWPGQ